MGIDFLDCALRIEKEFDLLKGDLDVDKLESPRNASGFFREVTAEQVARWVAACVEAKGREVPGDLWVRVRACIAATVFVKAEKVELGSRLVGDLGFT